MDVAVGVRERAGALDGFDDGIELGVSVAVGATVGLHGVPKLLPAVIDQPEVNEEDMACSSVGTVPQSWLQHMYM